VAGINTGQNGRLKKEPGHENERHRQTLHLIGMKLGGSSTGVCPKVHTDFGEDLMEGSGWSKTWSKSDTFSTVRFLPTFEPVI
jgi:hypothetical protein